MSDSVDLPPVLTADEYQCGTTPLPETRGRRALRAQQTLAGLSIDGQAHVIHADLPALIALANHALPDDSPYKITRAMVTAIRGLCEIAQQEKWQGGGLLRLTQDASKAASILASLLPPE